MTSATPSPPGRYPAGREAFPHHDLLGMAQLKPWEILYILDEAERWAAANRGPFEGRELRLQGLTIINAFFENSTRTLLSFEIAAKRLGAHVVNMAIAQSSVAKGESLADTVLTLNAMRPDAIVVRHAASGGAALIARYADCPVLNGGDGRHEHPTQALLDALTIRRRKGHIEGQIVAICGDILHSRVARSNIIGLSTLGAQVRVVAPPTLMPPAIAELGAAAFTDMDEGIDGADIIMMLRVQNERMDGAFLPSPREYHALWGLSEARLAKAKDEVLVMHPGPMNRGVEIDAAVADHATRSAITEQVEMGVAVRMACLEVLTRKARGLEGWA